MRCAAAWNLRDSASGGDEADVLPAVSWGLCEPDLPIRQHHLVVPGVPVLVFRTYADRSDGAFPSAYWGVRTILLPMLAKTHV